MKKLVILSIFIFLTGLFAGLFFSANLSGENNAYLSALLLSGLSSPQTGLFRTFFAALFSNMLLVLLMLSAMLSRLLSPLPFLVLWFKSFSIGFCSGLLSLNIMQNAMRVTLLRILPQNLFLIPAFVFLAAVLFYWSWAEVSKKNRPSREKKDLQSALLFSCGAILAGCLTEALLHLVTV